ncbi:MAG: DUF1415 domain-containing protein [Halioglobus sp.]
MHQAERHIRAWLETFVVGFNLCPFARPYLNTDQLRISVCEATSPDELRRAFLSELDVLQRSTEEEAATSLLVMPNALADFGQYLDFLDEAQDLLESCSLEGMFQLASFHPDYCFEGESPDAEGNYTNRAPYPVIHLLRENMLTRVLADFPEPEAIPGKNVEAMERMGLAQLEARWKKLFDA